MFGLFNKKKAKAGLVGVTYHDQQLSIALVEQKSGAPELQLCESAPADTFHEAVRLLSEKVKTYNLEQALCNFVLSPDDYNLLLVEAPPVEKSELAAAAKWKIKDMVDRPLDQLVVSVFQVPKEAYRGQRDMLYVVAADRKKVQQAVDLITESGLTLSAIDIPELAMQNLQTLYADDSNGIAMIDLRHTGGMLTLSKSRMIYLTRHLNTQLGEEMLSSYEWENTRERLVLEIQRSLDYYESQMGQSHINKLLLAPRKTDSEALASQLNEFMGVNVEIVNLEKSLGNVVELPFDLQQSCMMAIGGALRIEEAA